MNKLLEDFLLACDYRAVTDGAVKWISDWFAQNGPKSSAVIGISGGKDSTVVAALCKEALGVDRVLGVLMPNGIQPDIDVSRRVVDTLGIKAVEINIKDAYDGVTGAILGAKIIGQERQISDATIADQQDKLKGIVLNDTSSVGPVLELSRQTQINLGPRLRMATLYAVSQCIDGRVSNNSNLSERTVGYSTRYGDSVGDFAPLANLTVSEVRIVGSLLGIPAEFVQKAPSDGLSGKTDEDALGFSYEALDTFILTGKCEDEEALKKIIAKKNANAFKLKPMPEYSFR